LIMFRSCHHDKDAARRAEKLGPRRIAAVALITGFIAASVAATASARVAPGSVRTTASDVAPSARIGAFFFDGWSSPLSSFHFGGLIGSQFSGREPLSGWRDESDEALQAQLRWAHEDGISFFLFDWYYNPDPGNGPINHAHDAYLALREHDGVGFALNYVNQDAFVIPPGEWAAQADKWVTEDFLRADYARIDGKPLLFIIDEHGFNKQMGGAVGVNAAIATLQDAARRHGLPGVFVVGGRYVDYRTEQCYPNCLDTDRDFPLEHYDAISEFGYWLVTPPHDGSRPYGDVASAIKPVWDAMAERGPFRHIPSVMAGFDPRPMILAGQVQPPEQGGWPLLEGHQTWLETTPADVGGLVSDATAWVNAHPSMRLEPAPAPPVIVIQSWNELQEGAILVPTQSQGYGFGQAVAHAVGLPWAPPPKHTLAVAGSAHGTVTSNPTGLSCPPTCVAGFDEGVRLTLSGHARRGFLFDHWSGCTDTENGCGLILLRDFRVRGIFLRIVQRRRLFLRLTHHAVAHGRLTATDGFSGCASGEPVQIQRFVRSRWLTIASTTTGSNGAYRAKVRLRRGAYRSHVGRSHFEGHTCLATSSVIARIS
jgi:hypothetical protein